MKIETSEAKCTTLKAYDIELNRIYSVYHKFSKDKVCYAVRINDTIVYLMSEQDYLSYSSVAFADENYQFSLAPPGTTITLTQV